MSYKSMSDIILDEVQQEMHRLEVDLHNCKSLLRQILTDGYLQESVAKEIEEMFEEEGK